MSKLYFPKVYQYQVYENLLLISWQEYFECFDFTTGASLFKIDHRFYTCTVINDKIFVQKENQSDILVYDLAGNLMQTFNGPFYLGSARLDDQFLFVYSTNEKKEYTCLRINTVTLEITDTIENYKEPNLIKNGSGFKFLANNIYCYNIFTGDQIWHYDLGPGNKIESQFCYLYNGNLIITTYDSRLISLHIETGECLWEGKTALRLYTMHPVNKNLYAFGGTRLEIIDSKTGNLIFNKDFSEIKEKHNTSFVPFLSQVREDGVYFFKPHGDRKFGKINIPGHDLEYIMDMDIRKGGDLLVPSFPHRNCFFMLDQDNNLHVYRPWIK